MIPEATAVACEAPLATQYPCVSVVTGSVAGLLAFTGRTPASNVPGARMSGLIWPERVGPRPENGATSLQLFVS